MHGKILIVCCVVCYSWLVRRALDMGHANFILTPKKEKTKRNCRFLHYWKSEISVYIVIVNNFEIV